MKKQLDHYIMQMIMTIATQMLIEQIEIQTAQIDAVNNAAMEGA